MKLSALLAKAKMINSTHYTSKMHNFIPQKLPLRQAVTDAWDTLVKNEDELRECHEQNGNGYLPYILEPVRGHRRGTKAEIENMLKHIDKGCYSDCLVNDSR